MVANRWNLPDYGLGMGLRTVHYEHILAQNPKVDFFEVISEGFLQAQGRRLHILEQVAERYRILIHGVSMSVGSTDPLNWEYLGSLKKLAQKLKVPFVSDHLCWTGVLGRNSHDLLPIPLTEDSLKHVAGRIKQIQDFLEVPVALQVSGAVHSVLVGSPHGVVAAAMRSTQGPVASQVSCRSQPPSPGSPQGDRGTSKRQLELQQSPSAVLPSSHVSGPTMTPSPQTTSLTVMVTVSVEVRPYASVTVTWKTNVLLPSGVCSGATKLGLTVLALVRVKAGPESLIQL